MRELCADQTLTKGSNMKISKVTKAKSSNTLTVGAVKTLPNGDVIKITEFKGKATFGLFDGDELERAEAKEREPYPKLSFQVAKGRTIMANLAHIKAFVDDNS